MVNSNLNLSAGRPCVLVVDDEEAVRQALRAILQSDYDVLEAESADQGLELLKERHADLITLDVRMPGRSGFDALRVIRETEEYFHTPVIMITGYASLDGACEALRLGANDYLQKPFAIDQLKTSVRNSLKRHETVHLPLFGNGTGSGSLTKRDATRDSLAKLGKASAAFAHDLASPLQVLTILNSLCCQKMAACGPQDKELSEAMQQTERLLCWVSELVKGWQTIAVPNELSREPIDVDNLLKQVTTTLQPYAQLNRVTLTRWPLPEKLEVVGDRIQLERALVNIGLNGIKASTSRGRTLDISAISFGDDYVFRFTDSGQGFTSERMKEVLGGDPFSPSGKSRRGLGLFIADWIAVNHGGKLQFISEKGVGTTVELFIPNSTE